MNRRRLSFELLRWLTDHRAEDRLISRCEFKQLHHVDRLSSHRGNGIRERDHNPARRVDVTHADLVEPSATDSRARHERGGHQVPCFEVRFEPGHDLRPAGEDVRTMRLSERGRVAA